VNVYFKILWHIGRMLCYIIHWLAKANSTPFPSVRVLYLS